MSSVQALSRLTPFSVLLGTISSQLLRDDVRHIKVHLQGHLNKECLDNLRVGYDVIGVLYQRGIVTDKKLAFLRKLLTECGLEGLVELVDEYKKVSSSEQDGKTKQDGLFIKRRLQNLQIIMERQNAEIKNYEHARNELGERLLENEALLKSHREVCITQDEQVEDLLEKTRIAAMERDMIEEQAAESDQLIQLQQSEMKNLQDALKSTRLASKRGTRVTIFDKHSNDKSKKSFESLVKQNEDKTETLRKYKEDNEEMCENLYSKRQTVRQINCAILRQTKDLINVDEELLQTYEDMRHIQQLIRQNVVSIWDMKRQVERTQAEHENTERTSGYDKPMDIPVWRLTGKRGQKVIDYRDVAEEHSYSIGCHGNKMDCLQFDSPRGVAVTRKNAVFVADHGNCRIHFLDEVGHPTRDAITMNKTYPASLALNRKGNVITSDSQIIKVFTSDGMLSHNFLPVYNVRDEMPKISALAIDKEGNILAADFTNHRIQTFRIDGHFLGFIGGPAYLRTPSGIVVSKYGDVIVSEYESHQLKVFYHHGKSFSTIGRPGIGQGHFMFPRGLALDNKGNILVADSMNHRIQVMNLDGQFLGSFGRLGSGRGCLDTPYAVAVNRRGHVFVADSGNDRLTIFT